MSSTSKCAKCDKMVYPADRYEKYGDKTYHSGCFRCSDETCGIVLTSRTAKAFNELPYCIKHLPDSKPVISFKKNIVQDVSVPSIVSTEHIEQEAHPSPLLSPPVVPQFIKQNDNNEIKRETKMRQVIAESIEEMGPEVFHNITRDMNIIICGSPRVGKSTLINAICGRKVVLTGAGLASVTKAITCHTTEGECQVGSRNIHYRYTFWDTPGFESWEKNDIRRKIKEIFKTPESKPLCMIFCASPGAFVDLSQLEWLLDFCVKEKHIFCALVCTNKYAGSMDSRRAVMNDFKGLLSKYVDDPPRVDNEKDIVCYGNIGLCTSINSEPFECEDRTFPQSGVNDLIYGILESLVDEEVIKWMVVVLENKGFWDTTQQKFKETFEKFRNFFRKKKKHKGDVSKDHA